MAKKKSQREIAEERAAAQGEMVNSFQEAGMNAIRSLDMNYLVEGKEYEVPTDYKIAKLPITGSTTMYCVVILTDGTYFPIGCLTRGAKPADGSDYVRPSGTVVEKAQEYGSMDEFWKNEMAGKKFKATKKTPVIAEAFSGEGTQTINVWTLDFVA